MSFHPSESTCITGELQLHTESKNCHDYDQDFSNLFTQFKQRKP